MTIPAWRAIPSAIPTTAVIARTTTWYRSIHHTVDLLGQCNAEFLGGSEYSGTAGSSTTSAGLQLEGGKSILAFYSTPKRAGIQGGAELDSGAVITTPRMDVQYLVTEHGVVNLKGDRPGTVRLT